MFRIHCCSCDNSAATLHQLHLYSTHTERRIRLVNMAQAVTSSVRYPRKANLVLSVVFFYQEHLNFLPELMIRKHSHKTYFMQILYLCTP
jgi:hypothetical protein